MLDSFFNPKSIAIISDNSENYSEINMQNSRTYMTHENQMKNIMDEIDLVIIDTKGKRVLEAVKQCMKKNVNACIIHYNIEEARKLAKGHHIRLINGVVFDTHTGFSSSDFRMATKGDISFVSQSSSYGKTVVDAAISGNIGLNKFISADMSDVDEEEILDYLEKDQNTKSVALYLENFDKKIYEKLRKMTKPVVVLNPGNKYSGIIKQAGCIEAKSTEELLDFSKILSMHQNGSTVSIITNNEGLRPVAMHAAEHEGLEIDKKGKGDITLAILSFHEPVSEKDIDKIKDNAVVCGTGNEFTMLHKNMIENRGVPVYPTPERAVRSIKALLKWEKMRN